MQNRWTTARVGLLVVVALVASWLVYRAIDERGGGRTGGYEVWAVFDDASGLVPKSRVLIAGIQVGYIDHIRLWGSKARVDIHIDDGVPLHTDSFVAKKTASILGEAVLSIDPGSIQRPLLHGGERIATAPETPGTDQILANVARISESVLRVSEQMERTFGTDRGGQQMSDALEALSDALQAIDHTIRENEAVITHTLANVEGITQNSAPQLERILENVEQVTRALREVLADNHGNIDHTANALNDTMQAIERSSHELEGVLGDMRDVTSRTARGEGTIGRLTSDEALIDEVQGVAEGVGDIVGGISRLQTIVQLQAEYNFLANTFKSYVQLRLQPREDRYYYLEFVNDPRGAVSYETQEITESPPPAGYPAHRTISTVRTADAFRFSFGFAKRISFATFRFGITESTGGVGLDLHFFDDRFEVQNDAFAFGERAYPRLRTRVAFEVVSRLWILAGVDDYLNSSRDFFLGAALRFNDDDLKNILPFAGGLAGGATR